MRIKKFFFPIILLIIFLGVIVLGMAAGYWETKGDGCRHRTESQIPNLALVQTLDISESGESPWQP
ncbi:MAG: hypothetical protein GQ526_12590 [Ardenticatenales bacterium]|nr:hypothetical protein [Ardenticatenales bacterium]